MDIISHLRHRDRERVRALKSPGDILLRIVTRAGTAALVALVIPWLLQVDAQRDVHGVTLHRVLHQLGDVLNSAKRHIDQLVGVSR